MRPSQAEELGYVVIIVVRHSVAVEPALRIGPILDGEERIDQLRPMADPSLGVARHVEGDGEIARLDQASMVPVPLAEEAGLRILPMLQEGAGRPPEFRLREIRPATPPRSTRRESTPSRRSAPCGGPRLRGPDRRRRPCRDRRRAKPAWRRGRGRAAGACRLPAARIEEGVAGIVELEEPFAVAAAIAALGILRQDVGALSCRRDDPSSSSCNRSSVARAAVTSAVD